MAINPPDEQAFYAAKEAAELENLRRATAEEQAAALRRVASEERLRAIRLLMGSTSPPPHVAPMPAVPTPRIAVPHAPAEPSTWPEVVEGLLRDRAGGLTAQGIIAEIKGTVWGQKHHLQPNGLYNTLNRLTKFDRIVRSGKTYFDPVVYERIYGGEIEAPPPVDDGEAGGRMPDLIKGVLDAAGGPMKAAEIIIKLREFPGVSERIGPLGNLAYTHLSKMSRSGELTRVDAGYDLPGRAVSAPPNVTPFPAARGQGGDPV